MDTGYESRLLGPEEVEHQLVDELHRRFLRTEREFFIGNLLVRIHFIIIMIGWTGLAPWKFEFPFPGSHSTPHQSRLYGKGI